jgi:general secretion pathway protein A
MYERFFQLARTPFSMVPDPGFVHLTSQHADAISGLAFGVMDRKGYLMLTGEPGLGKTTALCALSELLAESNVQASVIFHPTLSGPEFLEMVMLNFGLEQIPSSKALRLKMLQAFLVRSDNKGTVSALIVDEAHKLSPELLEEIRLLGNFEASDHKLLQIVLVGQNELQDRLNLPELWQLKQRIAIRLTLRRLERPQVAEYVQFRWNKAGGAGPNPFTSEALDGVSRWSSGIPRVINGICDNSLLMAFAESTHTVDLELVREACIELDLPTPSLTSRPTPSGSIEIPQPRPNQSRSNSPSRTGSQQTSQHPSQQAAQQDGEETPKFWTEANPSFLKKWLRLPN